CITDSNDAPSLETESHCLQSGRYCRNQEHVARQETLAGLSALARIADAGIGLSRFTVVAQNPSQAAQNSREGRDDSCTLERARTKAGCNNRTNKLIRSGDSGARLEFRLGYAG